MPKVLSTENIYAAKIKNPYKPGAEAHIEAINATREELEKLATWLKEYLEDEKA